MGGEFYLSDQNGNGELAALLEIKRGYKKDIANLEAELKAKFEKELTDGKKQLKDVYLEKIVDVVFAEPPIEASVKEAEPEPVVHPQEAVVIPAPAPLSECSECGAKLDPGAKFCSRCAAPVKEDEKHEANVGSAGRLFTPRLIGTRHRK
jgi:hypothetical protein